MHPKDAHEYRVHIHGDRRCLKFLRGNRERRMGRAMHEDKLLVFAIDIDHTVVGGLIVFDDFVHSPVAQEGVNDLLASIEFWETILINFCVCRVKFSCEGTIDEVFFSVGRLTGRPPFPPAFLFFAWF